MTWHQRTWLFLVKSAMEEGMHLSQQSTTGNGRPREGQSWKRRHIFPGLSCPGEARCEKRGCSFCVQLWKRCWQFP